MSNEIKLTFSNATELIEAIKGLTEAVKGNFLLLPDAPTQATQLPAPTPDIPAAQIPAPAALAPQQQYVQPQPPQQLTYPQPGNPTMQPPVTPAMPAPIAPPAQTPYPSNPQAYPQQQAPTYPQQIQQPAPAPQQPPVAGMAYTAEQLGAAAGPLMDAGRGAELAGLLSKYGVQALTMLKPEFYASFAADLRALGAQI